MPSAVVFLTTVKDYDNLILRLTSDVLELDSVVDFNRLPKAKLEHKFKFISGSRTVLGLSELTVSLG